MNNEWQVMSTAVSTIPWQSCFSFASQTTTANFVILTWRTFKDYELDSRTQPIDPTSVFFTKQKHPSHSVLEYIGNIQLSRSKKPRISLSITVSHFGTGCNCPIRCCQYWQDYICAPALQVYVERVFSSCETERCLCEVRNKNFFNEQKISLIAN